MAKNTPTPPAGEPPKPGDAPKVQPKKETVRISLPPKPTAAPTIKIPVPASGRAAGGATRGSGTIKIPVPPKSKSAAPPAAAPAPVPAAVPVASAAPVAAAAPAPTPAGPALKKAGKAQPTAATAGVADSILAVLTLFGGLAIVGYLAKVSGMLDSILGGGEMM